jgi:hypothetical protein
MSLDNTVLCGANAYTQKYYLNPKFDLLPDAIQKDLHVMCVLFTQEVGGIITLSFSVEGELLLETMAEENDFSYDEIAAGLLIGEIRRQRQELFTSLEMYYSVFILNTHQ